MSLEVEGGEGDATGGATGGAADDDLDLSTRVAVETTPHFLNKNKSYDSGSLSHGERAPSHSGLGGGYLSSSGGLGSGGGGSLPDDLSASRIQPGEVLGDRYRVIERLGAGGMGEVFLAEHVAIGRRVAIKTLRGDLQGRPELARRFLQEARTVSTIRHPNIVDITDFGHSDRGAPFFVMEFLEGEDLKERLRRDKYLPWPEICRIVLPLCEALAAAHRGGVIHRDLKPDNVYLAQLGAHEIVKVLDFGIAKITADEEVAMTHTGALLGTPHYMSPEQAEEEPLDARSDLYSLGVLLFRMATGRLPFTGRSFMKVLGQHMRDPPPRPNEVAPEALRPAAEALILRCLAKRREERPQTADEVADALRASLSPMEAAALGVAASPGGPEGPGEAAATDREPPEVALGEPSRRRVSVLVLRGGVPVLALALGVIFWVKNGQDMGVNRVDRDPEVAVTAREGGEEAGEAAVSGVAGDGALLGAAGENGGENGGADDVETVVEGVDETAEGELSAGQTPENDPQKSPENTHKNTKKRTKSTHDKRQPTPKAALSPSDLRAAALGAERALKGCSGGLPGMVVKVDLEVSASGAVTAAEAHKPQRGSALGRCVEAAAKKLRFPPLEAATTVTLPLLLPTAS